MRNTIGIRRETKDKTQRRAPLSPGQVRALVRHHGIRVLVQPWKQRVFTDAEYRNAGAILTEDLSPCNIIFGVKEIAPAYLCDGGTYCFFSHTVKGQQYNMPMLQHIIDHDITLLDYELVRDAEGRRLIFFGDYAGYAGMIDSLWALGRRLRWEGVKNPFTRIKYATEYRYLKEAEEDLRAVGQQIARTGLPRELVPFVCAFTGYGRVSTAAQRLFDLLPFVEVEPERLEHFFAAGKFSRKVLYKVKFTKPDLFQHKSPGKDFTLAEFQKHPQRFTSRFEQLVPFFSMIINGIYWEPRFPKLLSIGAVRRLYESKYRPRLKVIGDITCDIGGSIELTVKETDSTNPIYVYEPLTGRVRDGWRGRGPVILAVDKLPTELPRESSQSFGKALLPFVPGLAAADFAQPWGRLDLPNEIKDAVIVYRGKLVRKFQHLRRFL